MKIASITLSSNRAHIIGDALKSVVSWVDACIIIDLGITDETLDTAKAICGEKLIVSKFTANATTGDMRNFGLDEATRLGFDYAMTLDTDERILLNGEKLEDILHPSIDVIQFRSHDGTYPKPRIFTLPTKLRFVGDVHEGLSGNMRVYEAKNARFYELPKTPEQNDFKGRLMEKIVLEEIDANPTDGRKWYNLGDARLLYGNKTGAKEAFLESIKYFKNPWTCAILSAIYQEEEDYDGAINILLAGLSWDAAWSELAWMISAIKFNIGDYGQAICWSRMALGTGEIEGCNILRPLGFRHPKGRTYGPYEVLALSYEATGDEKMAALYKEKLASFQ